MIKPSMPPLTDQVHAYLLINLPTTVAQIFFAILFKYVVLFDWCALHLECRRKLVLAWSNVQLIYDTTKYCGVVIDIEKF